MGQVPHEKFAVVPPPLSKEGDEPFPSQGSSPGKGTPVSSVVVGPQCRRGGYLLRPRPSGGDHRCQSSGLGSSSPAPCGSRPVGSRSEAVKYQLSGAQGDTLRSSQISPSPGAQTRPGSNGQYISQSPRQSPGRHQIEDSHEGIRSLVQVGGTTPALHQSRTHLRGAEHEGRPTEQDHSGSFRVGSRHGLVQSHPTEIRNMPRGLICYAIQREAPPVLLPVQSANGRRDRRAEDTVAKGPTVCVPADSVNTESTTQSKTGKGTISSHSSALAAPTVVCRTPTSFGEGAVDSSPPGHVLIAERHIPSGSTLATASRVAIERDRLMANQLSSSVIATIQASRRPSTTRIYEATWQSLVAWCIQKGHDALNLPLARFLDFLQEGLDRGLRPNTLRRQVAAIATIIDCGTGLTLSTHPTVQRFLRGATNVRPPVVHRFPTWDLPTVLQGLTRTPFEPLQFSSLRTLTWKTAFLIAITSARRISELAAMSIKQELCVFYTDRVVLRLDPGFIPKVNSAFHRSQDIILPDFHPPSSEQDGDRWHRLDVRRSLKVYLDRTREFRRTEALFVSFRDDSRGKKASSTMIGRWIRACISLAYSAKDLPVPNGITAHSTRSAATSAAWSSQASVEEVCRAATWASPSPFIRHYRIDTFASAEASFGRNVLKKAQAESSGRDQSITLPDNS